MDWFVRRFIKASLVWFGLGVTLGVAMAVHPAWAIYRTAHFHMSLLGFVTMMIYGVAYHVIPRFVGFELHSKPLAGAHWWVANAGLALMVAGFMLTPHFGAAGRAGPPLLAAGGTLSAIGAYCFILNLWRTLDLKRGAPRHAAEPPPMPIARGASGASR
jgi:heme/copper-type cytochrome/quinol oxidase subunit 1